MSDKKDAERYENPECWRFTREQMLKGTAEDFARWRAEAAPVQERNTARVHARVRAKQEIESLIAQAWPRGSDEFRTMMRAFAKCSIAHTTDFIGRLNEMERDAVRLREETARKTAQDAEGARKLLAAGAFLSARGKVVGVDYEPHEAIEVANEIAVEEAIEERTAEGGFVSFGGDDECEGCKGWNMNAHRCECGNRRVGWEHDGDFENMAVFAQAN